MCCAQADGSQITVMLRAGTVECGIFISNGGDCRGACSVRESPCGCKQCVIEGPGQKSILARHSEASNKSALLHDDRAWSAGIPCVPVSTDNASCEETYSVRVYRCMSCPQTCDGASWW